MPISVLELGFNLKLKAESDKRQVNLQTEVMFCNMQATMLICILVPTEPSTRFVATLTKHQLPKYY